MKDEAGTVPLDISHEEEFSDDVRRRCLIGRTGRNLSEALRYRKSASALRFICEVAGEIVSPVYYDKFVRLMMTKRTCVPRRRHGEAAQC